jgi:hypothetical protein
VPVLAAVVAKAALMARGKVRAEVSARIARRKTRNPIR